jgi:hypothetical protein
MSFIYMTEFKVKSEVIARELHALIAKVLEETEHEISGWRAGFEHAFGEALVVLKTNDTAPVNPTEALSEELKSPLPEPAAVTPPAAVTG